MHDSEWSNYLLGGFLRARKDERKMLALVCFASRPSESLVLSLMQDDRLLRFAEKYHSHFMDAYGAVLDTPDFVWKRFAAILGEEPMDFRNDALVCTSISVGYIETDVFKELSEMPLSLTQGDVATNIANLRREPRSAEPLAAQTQDLLAAGEPEQHVVDLWTLTKDTPCTTLLVEQGHGLGACMMKDHPSYTEKALSTRAHFQQIRPCLVKSPFQKKLDILDRKIAVVNKKEPNKITPKNMLLRKDCLEMDRDLSASEKWSEAKDKLKSSDDRCKALTAGDYEALRLQAIEYRELRKEELSQRLQTFANAKCDLHQKETDKVAAGRPNHTTSVRFTDRDKEEICQILQEPQYARIVFDPLTGDKNSSPKAPDELEMQVLEDTFDSLERKPKPVLPWWNDRVAANRDLMRGVALSRESPDASTYWLFLLAKQAPRAEVTFLKLERQPVEFEPVDIFADATMMPNKFVGDYTEWSVWPPVLKTAEVLGFVDTDNISCVTDVRFQGDRMATSIHEPISFDEFLRVLPQAGGETKKAKTARKVALRNDEILKLLEMYPFLTKEDLGWKDVVKRKRTAARKKTKHDSDTETSSSESEVLVSDAEAPPPNKKEERRRGPLPRRGG